MFKSVGGQVTFVCIDQNQSHSIMSMIEIAFAQPGKASFYREIEQKLSPYRYCAMIIVKSSTNSCEQFGT